MIDVGALLVYNSVLTEQKLGKVTEISKDTLVFAVCCDCGAEIEIPYGKIEDTYHFCFVTEEKTKICKNCKKTLPFNKYRKCEGFYGNIFNICNSCLKKESEIPFLVKINDKNKIDLDIFCKERCSQIKSRCKKSHVPFALSVTDLANQWVRQDGRCYYTNIKLGFSNERTICYNLPSVDRKIPEKGYIESNIVWCGYNINSFKGTYTDKEFESITKQIIWWWQKDTSG